MAFIESGGTPVDVRDFEGRKLTPRAKAVILHSALLVPSSLILLGRILIRGGDLPAIPVLALLGCVGGLVAYSYYRIAARRKQVATSLVGPVLVCVGIYHKLADSLHDRYTTSPLWWLRQDLRSGRSDILIDLGSTPAMIQVVGAWGPLTVGGFMAPKDLRIIVWVKKDNIVQVDLVHGDKSIQLESRSKLSEIQPVAGPSSRTDNSPR